MKTYHGQRLYEDADIDGVSKGQKMTGRCVVTVEENGRKKKLLLRLDLWRHSPNGFEWGFTGSGPAQLALAILADCLGDDERAVRLHQKFKFAVVSKLPEEEWILTERQVREAVREIEREKAS